MRYLRTLSWPPGRQPMGAQAMKHGRQGPWWGEWLLECYCLGLDLRPAPLTGWLWASHWTSAFPVTQQVRQVSVWVPTFVTSLLCDLEQSAWPLWTSASFPVQEDWADRLIGLLWRINEITVSKPYVAPGREDSLANEHSLPDADPVTEAWWFSLAEMREPNSEMVSHLPKITYLGLEPNFFASRSDAHSLGVFFVCSFINFFASQARGQSELQLLA